MEAEEQNSTVRIKMLPCEVCFLQKRKEIEDDCELFSVVSSAIIKIVTTYLFDEYLITASS